MSIHIGHGGHRFSGLNIPSKHLTDQSSDRDKNIWNMFKVKNKDTRTT